MNEFLQEEKQKYNPKKEEIKEIEKEKKEKEERTIFLQQKSKEGEKGEEYEKKIAVVDYRNWGSVWICTNGQWEYQNIPAEEFSKSKKDWDKISYTEVLDFLKFYYIKKTGDEPLKNKEKEIHVSPQVIPYPVQDVLNEYKEKLKEVETEAEAEKNVTGDEEIKSVIWNLEYAKSKEDAELKLNELKKLIEDTKPLYALPKGMPSAKEAALKEIQDLIKLNQKGYEMGVPIFYSKEGKWSNFNLLKMADTEMLVGYLMRECGFFEIGKLGEFHIKSIEDDIKKVIEAWLLENQGYNYKTEGTEYIRTKDYYSLSNFSERQYDKDKTLWAWNPDQKCFSPTHKKLNPLLKEKEESPLTFFLGDIFINEFLEKLIEKRDGDKGEEKPVLNVYAEYHPYFNPITGKIEGKWDGDREPVFEEVKTEELVKSNEWQFLKIKDDIIAIQENVEFKKQKWDGIAKKYHLEQKKDREKKETIETINKEYYQTLDKIKIPKKVVILNEAELLKGDLPELRQWLNPSPKKENPRYPIKIISSQNEIQLETNRNGQLKTFAKELTEYQTQEKQTEIFLKEFSKRAENLEEICNFLFKNQDIFWNEWEYGMYNIAPVKGCKFSFRDEDFLVLSGEGNEEEEISYFEIVLKRIFDNEIFLFKFKKEKRGEYS